MSAFSFTKPREVYVMINGVKNMMVQEQNLHFYHIIYRKLNNVTFEKMLQTPLPCANVNPKVLSGQCPWTFLQDFCNFPRVINRKLDFHIWWLFLQPLCTVFNDWECNIIIQNNILSPEHLQHLEYYFYQVLTSRHFGQNPMNHDS